MDRHLSDLSAAKHREEIMRGASGCALPFALCRLGACGFSTRSQLSKNAPMSSGIMPLDGGCSSVVELRTVAPAVVGSNPTTHPNLSPLKSIIYRLENYT